MEGHKLGITSVSEKVFSFIKANSFNVAHFIYALSS